ncbi:hypothetical protein JB92DRAFT_2762334 [Gautieria morchelliformis]|nr:hypothetical protein JB92DRAFT_2762334 [Gautieria morchelliformis]
MESVRKTGPISTPSFSWGEIRQDHAHECPYCHLSLLTGERPGFCCGDKGSQLIDVSPLLALPPKFDVFLNDLDISPKSRILNLIFSFASMETTAQFPGWHGPPVYFAIQGHVYHPLRLTATNSAVRWLLYDSFMRQTTPHAE